MAPGLVEREALLARLVNARREGGRLVLVGGEAGVGKTTLVRAFTAGVERRVLFGSCEQLATPAPLGPLVDERMRRDVHTHVTDAVDRGAALLTLDTNLAIEDARHPREVALSLLGELREPAVLVIEDAHWADEATLDVLRVLGRRLAATPSLVVVTYREEEAVGDHPLRRLLGEFTSVAAVERIVVPSLSLEAVRVLASSY